ncbi:MAG: hypothetical protein WD076_07430 [Parvularculaceae bacterium]
MLYWLFRAAVGVFAVLLMIAGVIIAPTPLPFGIIIFIIGFTLFAAVAPTYVRAIRRRWRWFDRQLHKIEKRLPKWLAKILRDSDYDHDEDEEEGEEETPAKKRR